MSGTVLIIQDDTRTVNRIEVYFEQAVSPGGVPTPVSQPILCSETWAAAVCVGSLSTRRVTGALHEVLSPSSHPRDVHPVDSR